MTCEDTQEDTPPRASTLPNFSHIEHKMPSRLTCGALLAAGLLSSGLSVANAAEDPITLPAEMEGTVPARSIEGVGPWIADATCVKLTAELYSGKNDNFIMGIFKTEDALTIKNGTYADDAAVKAAVTAGAVTGGYCVFTESERCERVVTVVEDQSYTAGFANGNAAELKGMWKIEKCASEAQTLVDETGTLEAWDMVRSPAASGLTCASVTLSLPNGANDKVVAAVFLEADADAIEAKAKGGEYTTATQVSADFSEKAIATDAFCTFADSATCTFRAELDPEKSYVAGVANGNTDASVTGNVVVKTCTDAEALEDGLTSNPAVDADSDMGKVTTATTSANTQLIVASGAAGFYPRVAFAATLAATLFLAM